MGLLVSSDGRAATAQPLARLRLEAGAALIRHAS